jgi:ribonuclease HI
MLFNRFLVLNQTQHQRMLYAQLSSLQKLKTRYVAVFNRDLDRFELRIFFFVISWWKFSIIIIVNSAKITIITHDQIMKKCNHLIIFTNEIDINNQIEASTVTIIFSTSSIIFIMMNKKQIYLRSLSKITVYFEEIMRLDLALNVAENHFKNELIVIFTNCQIVIRVIQCFKKQFDQYLLQTLTRRIEIFDREIHIHWILAHVEVHDNEAVDIAVKEITEWRQSNANRVSLTFVIVNSKMFILAIRNKIRIRAKIEWAEIWKIIIIEKSTHRIIKKLIKNVLKKFKKNDAIQKRNHRSDSNK